MDTGLHGNEKPAGHLPEDGLKAFRRRRLLLFLGITAPYLISYFQRSAPAVAGLPIAAELNLEPASLGVLVSTYAWGYAVAQLPAGYLADTLGPRKTISLFVLIAAVGSVIFALAPDFSLLSLGRFLVGLGVGFVYVPAVRVMTDWYKADELGTYSGTLFGLGSLGALAAATPLVLAMEAVGWRNCFLAVGAFTLLAALFCRLTVHDTPAAPELAAFHGRGDTPPSRKEKIKTTEAFAAVFSNGRFYLLGLLLFCYYGTVLSVGSMWAGPYLRNVYGLSGQTAGNIIMLVPLGMALGCPLSGYLSDKILKSRKNTLIGGAVLHLLAYPPLIFMAGELALPALYALFLWYGVTGGGIVVSYACAKETVAQRYAGTALGAVNVFLFLGGAFFQSCMGYIIGLHPVVAEGVYSATAYRNALSAAALSLAAGTVIFLFFREQSQKN